MTFEQNSVLPKRFVTALLPWLIGVGALLVYLGTMNQWATLGSIQNVALASGWEWRAHLTQPLNFLALLPFRFLPEHMVPMALNVFNALLATLVVTLLARTIAILPHDRTADQREIEDDPNAVFTGRISWIPPLLGCLTLGLQITFWENATSFTGEMIDMLVVAYVIRCLMEFRIDNEQSWLSRASLFYGIGMTNNWALIGLLPIFVTAIIWLKGISFFNVRFLVRMTAWATLGLLLYLLLPIIHSSSTLATIPFWTGLKSNLAGQQQMLGGMFRFCKENFGIVVVVATSVLPLLIITLRWSSSFGDNSPLGIAIARSVFHIVHALFLGACILIMFSPAYSPRVFMRGAVPFLTHYYFATLVIGYCAGYFLIVSSPAFHRRVRMNGLIKVACFVGTGVVVLLLLLVPIILVSRNLESIRLTNRILPDGYVKAMAENLPAGRCTILSDNVVQLRLLRVHLQRTGRPKDCLFYDTGSASLTDYHAFEKKSQPDLWPAAFASFTNNLQLRPVGLIMQMNELAKSSALVYLQPSFGYYFEVFQLTPLGMSYPLQQYTTNILLQSALSAATLKANEEFWNRFDSETAPLLKKYLPSERQPDRPGWLSRIMTKLHLKTERNDTVLALANIYSRASTYWAVELQKAGKWDEAALGLERSLMLNPNNTAAEVNLDFNKSKREGKPPPIIGESVLDRIGDWNYAINVGGPFDDPRFLMEQSRSFASSRPLLYRQSLHLAKRVAELDPHNLIAHAWHADLLTVLGHPAESLNVLQHIRKDGRAFGLNTTNELDLLRIEASAHFRAGDKDKGKAALETALKSSAVGNVFRANAAQLFLQNGMAADAVPLLKKNTEVDVTDIAALSNLGFAYMNLEKHDLARDAFTQALELDPKSAIPRVNRAITLLRMKNYDAAFEDYQAAFIDFPEAYQVRAGLGEIAEFRKDAATAVSHYEAALKAAQPGTSDFLRVSNRLATLRAPEKK